MELAKLTLDGTVDLRFCTSKEDKKYKELTEAGFLEFVPAPIPTIKLGEQAVDTFTVIENKIIQKWVIRTDNKEIVQKIESLKKELADTDYKVIKCYESYLVDKDLPYDINSLHIERQKIRDQINDLQNNA